jgi:hypothetical protein
MATVLLLGLGCAAAPAADFNNDGLSDVWGLVYNATGLTSSPSTTDWTMACPTGSESTAGTDPWSPTSYHAVTRGQVTPAARPPRWTGTGGAASATTCCCAPTSLAGAWTTNLTWYGADTNTAAPPSRLHEGAHYYSVEVRDLDTDADGISDWEELALGLSPTTNRSDRTSSPTPTRCATPSPVTRTGSA